MHINYVAGIDSLIIMMRVWTTFLFNRYFVSFTLIKFTTFKLSSDVSITQIM